MSLDEHRARVDEEEVALAERDPRLLLCSACGHRLTSSDCCIQVDGAHEHAYLNPAGIVYRFRCFAEAPGCRTVGAASTHWSWFEGKAWRVALCGGCGRHLGWRFEEGATASFFGLISDRLRAA